MLSLNVLINSALWNFYYFWIFLSFFKIFSFFWGSILKKEHIWLMCFTYVVIVIMVRDWNDSEWCRADVTGDYKFQNDVILPCYVTENFRMMCWRVMWLKMSEWCRADELHTWLKCFRMMSHWRVTWLKVLAVVTYRRSEMFLVCWWYNYAACLKWWWCRDDVLRFWNVSDAVITCYDHGILRQCNPLDILTAIYRVIQPVCE